MFKKPKQYRALTVNDKNQAEGPVPYKTPILLLVDVNGHQSAQVVLPLAPGFGESLSWLWPLGTRVKS